MNMYLAVLVFACVACGVTGLLKARAAQEREALGWWLVAFLLLHAVGRSWPY